MTDESTSPAPAGKKSGPFETILLGARGCSGRAVRYRILSPDMVTHIEGQCSRALSKESTAYEFSEAVVMMALQEMIFEVSDPVSADRFAGRAAKKGDPAPKPVEYRKVTPEQLHQAWSTYFNAKDTAILKRVYGFEHTVTGDELDAIMAGKVSTTTDS